MKKKCYRYFAGFLKSQERWLNRMAADGWRLVQTGKLWYEFEPCEPGAYEYRVEFVGQMDYARSRDYKAFLQEMGYEVFYKNLRLNWAMGKVTWRPYGEGGGQFATKPGAVNKELLLVGRKSDGKPFELHSTWEDKAAYMSVLRRVWLTAAVWLFVMAAFLCVKGGILQGVELWNGQFIAAAALGVLGILAVAMTCWYHWRVQENRKHAKLEE